ncbi:MAG: hypothetical protein M3R69_10900 [Acidobacteriota bacterium]|nr:hypothetical protein [Acidobacteriota bacterium]
MSKQKSTEMRVSNSSNVFGGWGRAITDAYEMIAEAKARVRELQYSIKLLRQLEQSGARFPVSEHNPNHVDG